MNPRLREDEGRSESSNKVAGPSTDGSAPSLEEALRQVFRLQRTVAELLLKNEELRRMLHAHRAESQTL
jgi:hypothetical protein